MSSPGAGGGWLQDLGIWVTGDGSVGGAVAAGVKAAGQPFAAGHTGPAPAEGFSLSRAEAEGMLTQARQTKDDLFFLLPRAEFLTQMKAPADEIASNAYNASWVGNGQGNLGAGGHGSDLVKKEYAYYVELVERLERALGITEDADQQAGTDVNKVSGDEGLAG
jgi:hypothetical protein